MLYIHYSKPINTILDTDTFFNNSYEDEWFDDAFVRQMILNIDK